MVTGNFFSKTFYFGNPSLMYTDNRKPYYTQTIVNLIKLLFPMNCNHCGSVTIKTLFCLFEQPGSKSDSTSSLSFGGGDSLFDLPVENILSNLFESCHQFACSKNSSRHLKHFINNSTLLRCFVVFSVIVLCVNVVATQGKENLIICLLISI